MSQLRPLGGKRFISVFVATLALLSSVRALLSTDPPYIAGQHFLFIWNAPTELCLKRFKMPLDLSHFHYISSTMKNAVNQSLALFYTDRFGIFPYVHEHTYVVYNQGLPQLIDLLEHNKLAVENVKHYIPSNTSGFAVLDFEEWRPQWNRNWGFKDIYRKHSKRVVRERNPWMTEKEVGRLAKIEFERGAKEYFLESIEIGKLVRPNRLWGFYLFPDCYNYEYHKDMESFTGECPAIEVKRNENLMWLWKESNALYPSIYLELKIRESRQARLYVRHRVREAMRVSMLPNSNYSIPVYPYIRPVYKDTKAEYMPESDLVNTIGEAVALGASGIISWGNMDLTKTRETCSMADDHLKQVMNPYILNVSTAAEICSVVLCRARGRCVRKNWNDDVYLHLNARHYSIVRPQPGAPLKVQGFVSLHDIYHLYRSFDCICYSREPCYVVNLVDMKGGGAHRPRPLLWLVTLFLSLTYVVMRI